MNFWKVAHFPPTYSQQLKSAQNTSFDKLNQCGPDPGYIQPAAEMNEKTYHLSCQIDVATSCKRS